MSTPIASGTSSAALIAGFLKPLGVDWIYARPHQTQDSAFAKGVLKMAPLQAWKILFIAGCSGLLGLPSFTYAQLSNSLAPLAATQWTREHAAHLLERAGFGGTPEEH